MKQLQAIIVALVALSSASVASAEEYFFPARDFYGDTPNTYHYVRWPDAYPHITYDREHVVWAPLPHHRTTNGMTVTVYGRYTRPQIGPTPCYVAGMSATGAALWVPGTTPPGSAGPWTSVITLTQAQVNSAPSMIVRCSFPWYWADSGSILYGVSVSFGWVD